MIVSTSFDVEPSYWLIFYRNKLLVSLYKDVATIPCVTDLTGLHLDLRQKQYLGNVNSFPYYALEIFAEPILSENMRFVSLRHLFTSGAEDLFRLAGRAVQIVDWRRTHRYCGQCGARTLEKSDEYVAICPECGFASYPRISPSIIVAVIKERRQILLIRSNHFKGSLYTVISGFVEPGETLEECVRREVKEETGVDVRNISYFGSQPWPFPNSLMIAFTADYDKGDIVIDEEEVADARWFAVEHLPDRPGSASIAGQLINWFINNK